MILNALMIHKKLNLYFYQNKRSNYSRRRFWNDRKLGNCLDSNSIWRGLKVMRSRLPQSRSNQMALCNNHVPPVCLPAGRKHHLSPKDNQAKELMLISPTANIIGHNITRSLHDWTKWYQEKNPKDCLAVGGSYDNSKQVWQDTGRLIDPWWLNRYALCMVTETLATPCHPASSNLDLHNLI